MSAFIFVKAYSQALSIRILLLCTIYIHAVNTVPHHANFLAQMAQRAHFDNHVVERKEREFFNVLSMQCNSTF